VVSVRSLRLLQLPLLHLSHLSHLLQFRESTVVELEYVARVKNHVLESQCHDSNYDILLSNYKWFSTSMIPFSLFLLENYKVKTLYTSVT
jgi:hypothetical protein